MIFKIAYNIDIPSRPGQKPDFGQGIARNQLTARQKNTRRALTYGMLNIEATDKRIAEIINLGGTITAWHRPPRSNRGFRVARHLGADFDDLISESEIFEHPLVQKYGSIIYHTASSKREKPKMRSIFLLDEPVTDGPLYRELILAMQWLFEGKADPACKDYCRLFYGNEGCNPVVTSNVLPLAVAMQWRADYLASRPKIVTGPEGIRVIRPLVTNHPERQDQLERRRKAFAAAILRRACDKVRTAPLGERHSTLLKQAASLTHYVNGSVLTEEKVRQELLAAYATGWDNEGPATVDWALAHVDGVNELPAEEVLILDFNRKPNFRLDFNQVNDIYLDFGRPNISELRLGEC